MDDTKESQAKQRYRQRVRVTREENEASQEMLALTCALNLTYIGSVERGEHYIGLVNRFRVTRALGARAGSLLND